MIWVFGEPPGSVIGKIVNITFKNIEVEDFALSIVEFENGVYAQINDSTFVKPPYNMFKEKVEIFGQKGRCYYRGPWPKSSIT